MSAVAGAVETETQPPMTVPLRHFVVALGFLVAGAAAVLSGFAAQLPGVGESVALPGLARAVQAHLLLAGFVCVTIAGALTQFVPVWSGVELHSERAAVWQLRLLVVGLIGLVLGFATVQTAVIAVAGVVLLSGFWLLVWNVGRTLLAARPWDVTERHFALTLGYVLVVTTLGATLAVDLQTGLLAELGISRAAVLATHATLAVFGVVLMTIFGALYQLVTMFTQTELAWEDEILQRVETVAYPVGVILLAAGRLVEGVWTARVGGVLLLVGVAAALFVVGDRLVSSTVGWSAMLRRYAVAVVAGVGWTAVTLPLWLTDPLAEQVTFGAPTAVPALFGFLIGFVVVGTLYHVIPFIVWVHEYSDRIGYEPVPSVDDLYDARLARADFVCAVVAVGWLTVSGMIGWRGVIPVFGGVAGLVAAVVIAWNLGSVVVDHSPLSVPELLFGISS